MFRVFEIFISCALCLDNNDEFLVYSYQSGWIFRTNFFCVWQEKNLFLIMRNNYSKWFSPVVSLLSTIRRMFIVWKRNRNCVVHKKWSGTTQQMCAYRRFGHSNDLLRFQSQQKVYTKHSNNEQSMWLVWPGMDENNGHVCFFSFQCQWDDNLKTNMCSFQLQLDHDNLFASLIWKWGENNSWQCMRRTFEITLNLWTVSWR